MCCCTEAERFSRVQIIFYNETCLKMKGKTWMFEKSLYKKNKSVNVCETGKREILFKLFISFLCHV